MNYRYHFGNHFKKQVKPYIKKYRALWWDIPRGKSHAFRMIVLLVEVDNILAPLTIYFKGDQENISGKEIAHHVMIIEQEIPHLFP